MFSQKGLIGSAKSGSVNSKVLYISYDGIFDAIAQAQVMPYLRGLAEKGIEVYLMSFEKIGRMDERVSLGEYKSSLLEQGIHWSPLIYHQNPVIPATLWDIYCGISRGRALLKNEKIKLVHVRGYISGLIGYFLGIFNKVNLIFDMRGFWPEEKVDAGAWRENGILYRVMKIFERKIVQCADEIVVLTEAAKNVLIRRYKLNNISVIPCSVDLKRFSFDLTAPPEVLSKGRLPVIYLGSMGTFYNFKEMARFFKILKLKVPQAHFTILSNADKQYIINILEELEIDRQDYLISSVNHEDVPGFLRRSLISLIFYRRTLSAAGCCPIKFAESLACGVPVVINSGVGDCDRIVDEERIGIVIKKFSNQAYEQAARGIEDLLREGVGIRQRCRKIAGKYFSLPQAVEKYFNIYRRLTESN